MHVYVNYKCTQPLVRFIRSADFAGIRFMNVFFMHQIMVKMHGKIEKYVYDTRIFLFY